MAPLAPGSRAGSASPPAPPAPSPTRPTERPPPLLRRTTRPPRLRGRVAGGEVDAIRPNPYQPRKDFNEEGLEELAASIRQLGIIQPLTVRGLGNGRFELISGERRLR